MWFHNTKRIIYESLLTFIATFSSQPNANLFSPSFSPRFGVRSKQRDFHSSKNDKRLIDAWNSQNRQTDQFLPINDRNQPMDHQPKLQTCSRRPSFRPTTVHRWRPPTVKMSLIWRWTAEPATVSIRILARKCCNWTTTSWPTIMTQQQRFRRSQTHYQWIRRTARAVRWR